MFILWDGSGNRIEDTLPRESPANLLQVDKSTLNFDLDVVVTRVASMTKGSSVTTVHELGRNHYIVWYSRRLYSMPCFDDPRSWTWPYLLSDITSSGFPITLRTLPSVFPVKSWNKNAPWWNGYPQLRRSLFPKFTYAIWSQNLHSWSLKKLMETLSQTYLDFWVRRQRYVHFMTPKMRGLNEVLVTSYVQSILMHLLPFKCSECGHQERSGV